MNRLSILIAITLSLISISSLYAAPNQVSPVGYTIQAGAFQELARAERFSEKLRGLKLDAAYFKKENGLFAVIFGNFPTWDAASQNARSLKAEKLIEEYYIVKPRQLPEGFENRSSVTLSPKPHDTDRGKLAALTAERFAGIKYKYGGNNVAEGLDCSAFVKSVYYLIGVDIPRTSQEQFNAGSSIGKNELKDGDLIFFGKGPNQISHVGMYIGNGKFIHAPRRGEPIQITPVDNEKYVQKYVGSRRFL